MTDEEIRVKLTELIKDVYEDNHCFRDKNTLINDTVEHILELVQK